MFGSGGGRGGSTSACRSTPGPLRRWAARTLHGEAEDAIIARVAARAETKVLIAGGSFAGLEAMLVLRALAKELVTVELMAPDPEFLYRPLAVARPFGLGDGHRFPLGPLAERCGARYRPAAVAAVDAPARLARTSQDESVSYDALVVACGARAQEAIPGALTFQGPQDVARFEELVERDRVGHRSSGSPSPSLRASPGLAALRAHPSHRPPRTLVGPQAEITW